MNRLQEKYSKKIASQLQKELKLSSPMAVPKVTKVVINMGVTQPTEPRARWQAMDNIIDQFIRSGSYGNIISGLLFFGSLFIILDFLNIPFSLYKTFVIEEKFGFNNSTIKIFITDKFKEYLFEPDTILVIFLSFLFLSPGFILSGEYPQ